MHHTVHGKAAAEHNDKGGLIASSCPMPAEKLENDGQNPFMLVAGSSLLQQSWEQLIALTMR
jgi:hypothetical protein